MMSEATMVIVVFGSGLIGQMTRLLQSLSRGHDVVTSLQPGDTIAPATPTRSPSHATGSILLDIEVGPRTIALKYPANGQQTMEVKIDHASRLR
jgi:hypothetical protein